MPTSVTTGNDIIRLALQLVGAIGEGETPTTNESTDAQLILNDLIEELSINSLIVYTIQRYVFQTLTAKQVYTIGTGGDIDLGIGRPNRFEDVYIQIAASGSTSELACTMVNYDDWAKIPVKGTQSPIARKVWLDYQYPLINMSVWPLPSAVQAFVFYVWQSITAITDLSATLALPPGYKKMLRYMLAVELFPQYGLDVPADTQRTAARAMGAVKKLNTRMNQLISGVDPALVGNSRAFNFYTGDSQ